MLYSLQKVAWQDKITLSRSQKALDASHTRQIQTQFTTMSYEVTIRKKHNYLHATITGQNSEANVRRYFEQLAREAALAKCRQMLIEERLEGPRLDSQSVFSIAAEGSAKFRGLFRKIAYVDIYAEDSSMKNAEAVASNRGMPVRLFRTVAEADKWMRDPG